MILRQVNSLLLVKMATLSKMLWALKTPMLEPAKTNLQASKSAEPRLSDKVVPPPPNWDNQNRITLLDLLIKLLSPQANWPPRPEEESLLKRRLTVRQRLKIRRKADWLLQPLSPCVTPSSLRTPMSPSTSTISKWGRENLEDRLIQWVWITPWALLVQLFQEDHQCQTPTSALSLVLTHLRETDTLLRSAPTVCYSCLAVIDISCPSMTYTSWN